MAVEDLQEDELGVEIAAFHEWLDIQFDIARRKLGLTREDPHHGDEELRRPR